MRSIARLALVLTLALVAMAARSDPALAQSAPSVESGAEDARKLFLGGREAYRAGRFELAARSFEGAYRLSQEPGLLFNLGQAYRKLFLIQQRPELLRQAVDAYRRYLRTSPEGPNRSVAMQYLEEMAPLVEQIGPATPVEAQRAKEEARPRTQLMVVTETDGAQVALDGGEAKPAPHLADVEPGEHEALVEAPGHLPRQLTLLAVKDRLVVVEARLDPRPGRLAVEAERGARLSVDGQPAARLPLPAPLELPAGAHEIVLTSRGRRPWVQSLSLVPGEEKRLSVTMRETSARRAAAWLAGLAGIAAGTAVVGGAVWGASAAAADGIDARRVTSGITTADLDAYSGHVDRAQAAQTVTWTAIGAAAALAVVSGALCLFDNPGPPEKSGD